MDLEKSKYYIISVEQIREFRKKARRPDINMALERTIKNKPRRGDINIGFEKKKSHKYN